MKKNWFKFRAVLTLCAALGWWGLLYPELTFSPENVIIYEVDSEGNFIPLSDDCPSGRNLYRELLSAKKESITYRSKLLENLSLFWEALQNGIK